MPAQTEHERSVSPASVISSVSEPRSTPATSAPPTASTPATAGDVKYKSEDRLSASASLRRSSRVTKTKDEKKVRQTERETERETGRETGREGEGEREREGEGGRGRGRGRERLGKIS